MKTVATILVGFALLVPGQARSQCSDFNDSTVQGWTAEAAFVYTSTPSLDGSVYARCGDLASPRTASIIIAPSWYLGDWTNVGSVSVDFVLHDDGWPNEVRNANTLFVIQTSPVFGEGIRALFRPSPPITELDGWQSFVVPVHTIDALPLPTNEYGTWEFAPPQADPVAAWNALMANVQIVYFAADIASSSYQTEDFGFDNFCLGDWPAPVSVEESTWGSVKTLYRD